ncbi:hypothetical protein H1Q63_04615 [Desmonostoc muscorum CCALA 125]|nr:hypothetical protein [Desmonostoc muscorum CCALA 125]
MRIFEEEFRIQKSEDRMQNAECDRTDLGVVFLKDIPLNMHLQCELLAFIIHHN